MDTNVMQTAALNTPIPCPLQNHHRSCYPGNKNKRNEPICADGTSQKMLFPGNEPICTTPFDFAQDEVGGTRSARKPFMARAEFSRVGPSSATIGRSPREERPALQD